MIRTVIIDRNHMLNVIKGLGCIGVVFIHVRFPGLFGEAIKKASQFAVPVFFMISGYYTYLQNGTSVHIIIRRIRKLILITALALISYFVFSLVSSVYTQDVSGFLNKFTDPTIWIKAIVWNDFDIIQGSPLWFLPSLIYSYIVLLLIEVTGGWRMSYRIIPLLFVLRIVVSTIVWTFGLTWHFRCNVLIGAMPWVLLGHYFASCREIYEKYSNKWLLTWMFLGAVFAIVIIISDVKVDVSEIGTVICSMALFLFAVNNPRKTLGARIEYLGDKLSLYVYIYHVMIAGILGMIMRYFSLQDNIIWLWLKPIIVALFAIGLSMLIIKGIAIVYKSKC